MLDLRPERPWAGEPIDVCRAAERSAAQRRIDGQEVPTVVGTATGTTPAVAPGASPPHGATERAHPPATRRDRARVRRPAGGRDPPGAGGGRALGGGPSRHGGAQGVRGG